MRCDEFAKGMTMSALIVKDFEGKQVPFKLNGQGALTLTMKEAGELLGYEHPKENISRLYAAHKDEFDHDCTQVAISATEVTANQPPRRERIFTLDGLIVLCFHSEQPVAKKVRFWLRKVGKEVAVNGSYQAPGLKELQASISAELAPLLAVHTEALTQLVKRIARVEDRFTQTYVPTNQDNSFWPTPTERLRVLIDSSQIPLYFNRGGSWDVYAAQRHALIKGGLLSQRNRNNRHKMPDYVIQPCPLNDQFLKETFEAWKRERGGGQGHLELTVKQKQQD
jgi:prophage antirepressor-like protein